MLPRALLFGMPQWSPCGAPVGHCVVWLRALKKGILRHHGIDHTAPDIKPSRADQLQTMSVPE